MPKCSKYHAILLLLLLLLLLLRLLLLLLLLLLFLLLHLLLLFLCLFFFFTILYVAPTTQLQPSYNPAMMFILALPGPCFHYLDTYFSLYWIWLNEHAFFWCVIRYWMRVPWRGYAQRSRRSFRAICFQCMHLGQEIDGMVTASRIDLEICCNFRGSWGCLRWLLHVAAHSWHRCTRLSQKVINDLDIYIYTYMIMILYVYMHS